MDIAKEKEPHRAPDSIEMALASVEQALENVREALGSVASNDEDDDDQGVADEFSRSDTKVEADLIDVLVGAISTFEEELESENELKMRLVETASGGGSGAESDDEDEENQSDEVKKLKKLKKLLKEKKEKAEAANEETVPQEEQKDEVPEEQKDEVPEEHKDEVPEEPKDEVPEEQKDEARIAELKPTVEEDTSESKVTDETVSEPVKDEDNTESDSKTVLTELSEKITEPVANVVAEIAEKAMEMFEGFSADVPTEIEEVGESAEEVDKNIEKETEPEENKEEESKLDVQAETEEEKTESVEDFKSKIEEIVIEPAKAVVSEMAEKAKELFQSDPSAETVEKETEDEKEYKPDVQNEIKEDVIDPAADDLIGVKAKELLEDTKTDSPKDTIEGDVDAEKESKPDVQTTFKENIIEPVTAAAVMIGEKAKELFEDIKTEVTTETVDEETQVDNKSKLDVQTDITDKIIEPSTAAASEITEEAKEMVTKTDDQTEVDKDHKPEDQSGTNENRAESPVADVAGITEKAKGLFKGFKADLLTETDPEEPAVTSYTNVPEEPVETFNTNDLEEPVVTSNTTDPEEPVVTSNTTAIDEGTTAAAAKEENLEPVEDSLTEIKENVIEPVVTEIAEKAVELFHNLETAVLGKTEEEKEKAPEELPVVEPEEELPGNVEISLPVQNVEDPVASSEVVEAISKPEQSEVIEAISEPEQSEVVETIGEPEKSEIEDQPTEVVKHDEENEVKEETTNIPDLPQTGEIDHAADILLTGNESQVPVVPVEALDEPVVGKLSAEINVTSAGEITIGLTNPVTQTDAPKSNPVLDSLRNGETEKVSKNQLNSETKEKIFQINLEDQNGLDEDLSQVLAIRAEKIAEAKENFFKQVTEEKPKATLIAEGSIGEVKPEEKAESKAEKTQTQTEKKVEKPVEQKFEKPVEQKADKPVEQKTETEIVKNKESAKGSSCLIC